MFGSQALETTIGLALLFFVVASLASAIVEGVSRLLRKRATDLEETIGQMLSGSSTFDDAAKDALSLFKGTSIYQSADAAASKGRRWFRTDVGPAYLSARSFAAAIDELTDKLTQTPVEGLNKRLASLKVEGRELTLEAKAGLENWYDETMARLSGAYKRWVTGVLFVVGLALACAGNVSAFDTAQTLWLQPAVRQAALDAAEQAASKSDSAAGLVDRNVHTVEDLAGLGLPVGWLQGTHWSDLGWTVWHVAGWLATALLLMLGAPFWFDVLSRLASLRSTGAKPPPATQDPAAATFLWATASSMPGSAAARRPLAEAAGRADVGHPTETHGSAGLVRRNNAGQDDADLARGTWNPGGQQMAQSSPRASTRRALAALGLAALVAVVGTALMLRLESTDFNVVAIAGVAGAASSSMAILLRRGGLPRFTQTVESNGFLAVVGPVVGGLFAGAASLLLTVALFDPEPSLPSGAVFGGLSGLVLGGWVNQALTPRAEDRADERLAPVAMEEVLSFWRRRHNYIGRVLLEVKSIHRTNLRLSTLALTFVPDSVQIEQHADVTGPLRVEDGTDADEVPFEIAILDSGGVDAYPRSLAVKVPADRASDPVEFTLAFPTAASDSGSADPSAAVVLVDISQAGRSLQLLEIGGALWNAPRDRAPSDSDTQPRAGLGPGGRDLP